MPAKPLVHLIDGSSQMYRAYHAPVRTAEGGLLRNAKGQPTNAVYIFVTMLRKLLNEHKPQYIAASFDLPGRTFRDDLAADYKANRAPMPDELAAQIPMVHAACEALGVPIVTSDRYEADDVIGTLAHKASAAGFEAVIVTLDKDFFQLVRDGIRVFNPRDDGTVRGLGLDTMLGSCVFDASRAQHRLEDLALGHTSYKALTEEDVCGRG